MSRTFLNQTTQIGNSEVYDDSLEPSSSLEFTGSSASIHDDLNALRSMIRTAMGSVNWYDAPSGSLSSLTNDKVNRAGDTMSGSLDMGGFSITGLAGLVSGSLSSSATNKEYVDNLVSESVAGLDGRVSKTFSTVSLAASAGTALESGVNLSGEIPDFTGVSESDFEELYDVFMNGQLLRPGSGSDVYLDSGALKLTFAAAPGDVLCIFKYFKAGSGSGSGGGSGGGGGGGGGEIDLSSIEPDRTYFVSVSGSDAQGNGSILSPFATIDAAILAIGGSSNPSNPYAISVGPGSFGSTGAPLTVPGGVSIIGTPGTTINASTITIGDSQVSYARFNTTNITINSGSTAYANGVTFTSPGPSATIGGAGGTFYVTNVEGDKAITYSNATIIDRSSNYKSVSIQNSANYSSVASAYLSISVAGSTANVAASTISGEVSTSGSTTITNSQVGGNISATGGTLAVRGSSLEGAVNGSGGANLSLSLDSYPQGGSSLSGGAAVTNSTIVPQNVVLNGTATDSNAIVVGSLYFPQPRTLTASSLAFIGGFSALDTTTLTLVPSGGGSAIATWSRVGVLGNQALTGGGSISAAGWYDLILTPGASGTAFAQGLYLT
jgi:hypothetical protein